MRKFLTVFGLAAFAVGCLRVQRMPDGSANYGGIAGPRGVVALNTSGAVMTAVHEAARSGQPMSAVFDGQGGGSVQVGYPYGYGIYPAYGYGMEPQFALSAARSAQVWAAQVAAEQPVPVRGWHDDVQAMSATTATTADVAERASDRLGVLERKVEEQDEAIQTIFRGAARAERGVARSSK